MDEIRAAIKARGLEQPLCAARNQIHARHSQTGHRQSGPSRTAKNGLSARGSIEITAAGSKSDSSSSPRAVSLKSFCRARVSPPKSEEGIVFSSMKTTPPWPRPASAHVLSNGGMVFRSQVTSVSPCAAASRRRRWSGNPMKRPGTGTLRHWSVSRRLLNICPFSGLWIDGAVESARMGPDRIGRINQAVRTGYHGGNSGPGCAVESIAGLDAPGLSRRAVEADERR